MDKVWKLNFFRPDMKKIVFFFIVFAILFYFYLYISGVLESVEPDPRSLCCDDFLQGKSDSCDYFAHGQYSGFPPNKSVSEICIEYKRYEQTSNELFITLLILIIGVSYIISCSTVWILRKLVMRK
jgi:hypothetical protein